MCAVWSSRTNVLALHTTALTFYPYLHFLRHGSLSNRPFADAAGPALKLSCITKLSCIYDLVKRLQVALVCCFVACLDDELGRHLLIHPGFQDFLCTLCFCFEASANVGQAKVQESTSGAGRYEGQREQEGERQVSQPHAHHSSVASVCTIRLAGRCGQCSRTGSYEASKDLPRPRALPETPPGASRRGGRNSPLPHGGRWGKFVMHLHEAHAGGPFQPNWQADTTRNGTGSLGAQTQPGSKVALSSAHGFLWAAQSLGQSAASPRDDSQGHGGLRCHVHRQVCRLPSLPIQLSLIHAFVFVHFDVSFVSCSMAIRVCRSRQQAGALPSCKALFKMALSSPASGKMTKGLARHLLLFGNGVAEWQALAMLPWGRARLHAPLIALPRINISACTAAYSRAASAPRLSGPPRGWQEAPPRRPVSVITVCCSAN